MTLTTALLALGATIRLTRLATREELPPLPAARAWLAARLDVAGAYDRGEPEPPLWTLVTCQWCLSFWLGLAVLTSGALIGSHWSWRLVTGALTVSLLTGTYAVLLGRVEEADG